MVNTLSLLMFLFSAALLLIFLTRNHNHKRRPPGPPGWPIFGNTFDLGAIPHQNLYKLKPKYGPVLWLKLGSINTMVIQSAEAVAEFFKNHDKMFCDRKIPAALAAHNFYQGSLAFGRYGVYWRVLRRLCSKELSINKKLNDTFHIGRNCVSKMIQFIEEDATAARAKGESGEVNLPHFLFLMAFNLIGNITLSRDLVNSESKQGQEFFSAMNKIMEWVGKPNLANFFPILKQLDPQRIKRNMVKDMGCALKITTEFVNERLNERNSSGKQKKDLLDGLLEYEGDVKDGPDKISPQNVNIIILEMFLAGTETTTSSIEWAMTELLRNPECMRKIMEELGRVVGRNRNIEEKDIDELPYLKAVVKETLRLHPPAPVLVPRNAIQETEFMGYQIPKDTQVFVNVWAIGRDPGCWEDPLRFKPERFIQSTIDYKGKNFEFFPFGSGRRICVGLSLADWILHLGLASLLHCFDWELGKNMTPETINMNERVGLTARKFEPLRVIPKKRSM